MEKRKKILVIENSNNKNNRAKLKKIYKYKQQRLLLYSKISNQIILNDYKIKSIYLINIVYCFFVRV